MKELPLLQRQEKLLIRTEMMRGLDARAYGFHGTSIHALLYAVEHGVIPGYSLPDHVNSSYPAKGDIYFWKNTGADGYDPVRECESYAGLIAASHACIHFLGLSMTDLWDQRAAQELGDSLWSSSSEEYIEGLLARGYSMQQLKDAQHYAMAHSGVIIGLWLDEGTKQCNVEDVRAFDDGWRIRTSGKGLPTKHIFGIKPLGEIEARILRACAFG